MTNALSPDTPDSADDPVAPAEPVASVDPVDPVDPVAPVDPAPSGDQLREVVEERPESAVDHEGAAAEEAESPELPIVAAAPVDPEQLCGAIEAILFVVEAPVTLTALAVAVQQPAGAVQEALDTLRASYDERNAGIELREVAGGVRIYTRPAHADTVEAFLQDGQRSKLTQAALETLAVIAYRQPVTRARVSAIRGVNVDGVVRTLLARGLIVEVGTDPETGGGLFRTSELFLEKMGLNSLDELPSLAPLLPDVEGLDDLVVEQ